MQLRVGLDLSPVRTSTADDGSAVGLDPGEPASHPIEQPVGLGLPPSTAYAVAHGHRMVI